MNTNSILRNNPRMDLREKLAPAHTALLVIDIQNDFASTDPQFIRGRAKEDLSQVDPMIDKLNKLIPVAEKAGVLTLYAQQVYDRKKLNLLQKEQFDLDGKLINCDLRGDGYKFYRINPPKEKVYQKYNYNIFSNTKFKRKLDENHIKTLVVTGMDTACCVETAVRNGFDLGYKIVLPEDLVAGNGRNQDLHQRTIDITRRIYGVVVTSKDLIDMWGNL